MLDLGRSNLVVATGTALSRITGLARIIIFGVIIGQTALADAFDAANNAPNSMYELLIGGVLAATGDQAAAKKRCLALSSAEHNALTP